MTQTGNIEFFPVASREARIASRKILSYDIRSIIAGLFVVTAFRRIYASGAGPVGPPLLETLGFMAYLYAAIAGVFKTFDSLAREKREGTLGLLLLTDLKPFQILFGKLLSASAMTYFGLLAFLPILSLPIIMGGVMFDQFVRLSFALVMTLFLSIAWGLYISAAFRNYLSAATGAAILTLLIGFVPMPIASELNAADQSFPFDILATIFTPALPFSIATKTDPDLLQFFWPAIIGNVFIASLWIAGAVKVLPHRFHDTPNKFVTTIGRYIQNFRYGAPEKRAHIRERLLELNPLYWLAHRDRVSSIGLLTVCIATLIAAQYLNVPQLGLLLASLAILFRMAHASSHSISEDQKNGALELLLSTTLAVDEIVDGLNRAMLRRFVAPVAIVLIWPWIFIAPGAGEFFRPLLFCSSILLLATWLALAWVGAWYALRKTPTAAAWIALGVVVLPPWLIWIASIMPGLFNPNYTDIQSMAAVVCACIGVFHCILVARWGREILCTNFRAAAADPFASIQFEPVFSSPLFPYKITVVPMGKGKIEISRLGNTARLFATAADDYTFVEWAGYNCGSENPLHLELQGNAYLIARFRKNR